MIFILVLILSHPSLTKPATWPMSAYPKVFSSMEDCRKERLNQENKKSVMATFCIEIAR